MNEMKTPVSDIILAERDSVSDSANALPTVLLRPVEEITIDSLTAQYGWQDSLLQARTRELFPQGIPQQEILPPGIEGELLPYMLRSNDWITGIILLCFFSTSYVLATGKRFLLQRIRNFFFNRERSGIFNQQTVSDVRHRLLLMLQACLFSSILFFDYNIDNTSQDVSGNSVPLLLSVYTLVFAFFYLFKWGIYRFVNWIFFDKMRASLWTEAYFLVISMLGIICFPLVLLIVYFDLSPLITSILVAILFLFVDFLLLYKSFSIFFNKSYGFFYLIVYFCALEILPYLILWKGLILMNSLLTLKT